MQITNQMVKALAGPPLTVLVLMLVNRTPLTQAFIRRNTGFSNPTIHDAIELLNDYGYVTKSGRYAWQIADGVMQLPLMADLLPNQTQEIEPEAEPITELDDCIEVESIDQPVSSEDEELAKKIFYLNPSSSSRSLTSNKDLSTTTRSSTEIAEKFLELQKFGIREPARSRLADLENVTLELIQYHCTHSQGPGQAIYRIEHNWPIVQDQVEPENKRLNKYEEAFKKYKNLEMKTEASNVR